MHPIGRFGKDVYEMSSAPIAGHRFDDGCRIVASNSNGCRSAVRLTFASLMVAEMVAEQCDGADALRRKSV
jgi:hypothetical protein